MSDFPRFSISVRASGRVSSIASNLSLYEDRGALVDAIKKKRERKRAHRERTVADLISEACTECSKKDKQKVCQATVGYKGSWKNSVTP